MASEVRWLPIADVVEDILDRRGVTPLKLGGQFTNTGHRVISAKLVKNGRLDLTADEPRFVDPEIYAKWMRSPLKAGDVVMTSEAPLGELAYLDQDRDWCLGQRLFAMRPNKKVIEGRFLYYALHTSDVRADINGRASGTTVLGIRQAELRKVLVPVPPIPAQRHTASLLSALDERIDNLRQTNATLEAIAQALFKSWFVDFDPVRAKAEGREPEDMDPATAALFPSEFEDSELGPIPKGWRRVSFGEVATLSKGSVSPMATPEQEFQHYSLPAFDTGQLPLTELGESIKSNKTPVPSDAVLVSKLNPHIPRIWFVGDTGPHAVCSTEFLVWTPKPGVGSAFIYTLAASTAFNSAMRQLVTGTSNSHQRVKPDQLAEVQAATISDAVLAQFDAIAAPMLQQVVHNRRRAAALAEARDTLLPRLISGKLRLPEAETITESTIQKELKIP